jgi:hypothetical protein
MCPCTRIAQSWHELQGSCVYQHIQDKWGSHDLHFPSLCQEMDNHSTFGFQDIRWSPSGRLVERVRMTSQSVIIELNCWPKLCWTTTIMITTRQPNPHFPSFRGVRERSPVEPLNEQLVRKWFHRMSFIMFQPRSGKSAIDQSSEPNI